MPVRLVGLGKKIGEWTFVLGVFLMPLVIVFEGYRVATTPKFFVFALLTFVLGVALLLAYPSLNWNRAPFALPWFVFVAITGGQVFRSLNVDVAIEMWLLQAFGGILGISVALLCDRYDRIFRAVALVGFLVAVLGILEYVGLVQDFLPSAGRPSATLGFRNVAGMFLVVSVFFCLRLLLFENRQDRWLGGIALVAMMVFLIFTRTRGAWAGVGVAILCGVFFVWRSHHLSAIGVWLKRYAVGVLVAGGIIVGSVFVSPGFEDQSASRLDEKKQTVVGTVQLALQEGGDRGRLRIWLHTFEMIADDFLFGVGLENWSVYYPRYDRGDVMGIVVSPRRPHNDFLWIWSELGVVGFGVYLWLLGMVGRQVWLANKDKRWDAVCAGLGVLALLVHSGVSFPREQPVAVFWGALALGIAGRLDMGATGKRDGRSLLLGCLAMVVGAVGMVWATAVYQFDVRFARALYVQGQSQHAQQVQFAKDARSFGIFDHRVFLLEGEGRYALNDFEGAKEVYQAYLKYQPYLPAVHNNLGRALEGLGDVASAEKAYQAGLEYFSGDGAGVLVNNLAAIYKRQGEVDRALTLYEEANDLPAEGYHNLGLIYAERKMWEKSLEAYEQALVMDPKMTIVHFSMAGVQMLTGDLAAAAQNFETFLAQWQGIPDYVRDAEKRLRQIYPPLGDQFLRGGQFAQAGQAFARLIALGGGTPEAFNNLVLICGRLGQYEKAMYYGQVGLQNFPEFAQFHLSLATVYEDQKLFDQAGTHYRLFLQNTSGDDLLVPRAMARLKRLESLRP